MDAFDVSPNAVENDIETEIISSDDMDRMQVDILHSVIKTECASAPHSIFLTNGSHLAPDCVEQDHPVGRQSSGALETSETLGKLEPNDLLQHPLA